MERKELIIDEVATKRLHKEIDAVENIEELEKIIYKDFI